MKHRKGEDDSKMEIGGSGYFSGRGGDGFCTRKKQGRRSSSGKVL